MRVFERALATVQNNVVNANTPGYAKQRASMIADLFDPEHAIIGGVSSGPATNYRDIYSERNVQSRQSAQSKEEQSVYSLKALQTFFPIAEGAGIPNALNKFFGAFSQLTVAPNDVPSRQAALDRAKDVANLFNSTAQQVLDQKGNTQVSLKSAVDHINEIGARISEINASRRATSGGASDAGTDARLYSSLEELSQYVDFQTVPDSQGGVSVLLGGQSLLVIGDRNYPISTTVLNNQVRINDKGGLDITDQLKGGKVAGLVDVYNNKIPQYLDNLNTLAGTFADTVNQTLAQGLDLNGARPTQDLFGYNGNQGAAFTIQAISIPPEALALSSGSQAGGNANAVAISQLADGRFIGNETFQQFYGSSAARVGRDLSNAQSVEATQSDLLSQARSLRQDVSGVSLDEEAAMLMQYQKSYQASAQLFKSINDLTDAVMSLIR